VAKFADIIRRHGGDFENYLQARDEATGNLPHYLVMIRDGNEEQVRYFLGNEQLAAFARENTDLHLFAKPDAPAEANGNGNGSTPKTTRRARLIEIHEAHGMKRRFQQLDELGLHVDHFSSQDKPLFESHRRRWRQRQGASRLQHPRHPRQGHGDRQTRHGDQALQRSG
jgi:DNA gyrase subunit B